MKKSKGKVVILGATGLVGSNLLRQAQARGLQVVAPSHAELDVTRADSLAAAMAHDPEVLFFAAARPWVEGCEKDPQGTRPINVQAPIRWAEECARKEIKLVAFSTEYVFAGRESPPYVEEEETCPINEYGRQKVALEEGVLSASAGHLVVRISGVFGPDPQHKNFVDQLLRAAKKGEQISAPNDQWIRPTYAPDLAERLLDAVEMEACGLLHLTGKEILRRDELAQRAAALLGVGAGVVKVCTTAEMNLLAPRPKKAVLSMEKAERLDLASRISFDDALLAMKASALTK